MEKNRHDTDSFPLDAGGAVQLITGIKEQSPAILIEFAAKETVSREKLREAVNRALDVFRTFRVKLEPGADGKPVYVFNPARADVYFYDGEPHAYGAESGGYLFRVYCAENRILLSMLHALTDFCGAFEFLKCILCFYFDILNGQPEAIKKLLAVDPEDTRDPYTLYGSPDRPRFSLKDKWKNELEIPNRMLYRRGEPVTVHDLVFPISGLLKISKSAGSSVFPLLTWLTGRAVAKTYGGEDKLLTGAGAFNCRSMFGSRTPRSFSQTFTTVLHPRERYMDRNTQLTVQLARMDLELDKDGIAWSITARKELADRMLENAGSVIRDQESLDAARRDFARRSTYFLSYPGHIDPGGALDEYIEDFRVLGTVTRVPIVAAVYEWRGQLHFRIQEIGCETSIARAIMEITETEGIPGTMLPPFTRRFDNFPLEELYPA